MDPVLAGISSNLRKFLARGHAARFCVAFSGGLDSTVLLHAIKLIQDEQGGEIRAIHVDHGLSAESPDWAQNCAQQCQALGVQLNQVRLRINPQPRQSLEAEARRQRYGAFREGLQPGECLVMAHHGEDQAETLLLQLLRGAGTHGLAAMPWLRRFQPGWLLRPMLDLRRVQIREWAETRGLSWLQDPSNDDLQLDRNFLRARVVPLMLQRWPGAIKAMGRSARLAGESSALLDEIARQDEQKVSCDGRLSVAGMAELGPQRARNLLRYSLKNAGFPVPSEKQLRQGLADLLEARPDRQPRVSWAGGYLRRYRGRIHLLPAGTDEDHAPEAPGPWEPDEPLELGGLAGRLRCVPTRGAGLGPDCVKQGLRVSFRKGGERLRPQGHKHSRCLKKLFQQAGVVPWMRGRVPLIWSGDELVAVGDLWLSHGAAADHHEMGMVVIWEAHGSLD